MAIGDLTQEEFLIGVRTLPLVSVDWVIVDADSRILTGWRQNAPAKNSWFTPGGRIRKGESWLAALARVAVVELGVNESVANAWARRARLMGVWDHFYPDSAFCEATSTHYVNLPHCLELDASESAVLKFGLSTKLLQLQKHEENPYKTQHDAWRWLTPLEDAQHEQPSHNHVQPYLYWVSKEVGHP